MNAFEIICGIVLLVVAVFLTVVVLLQESKEDGVAALSGGDTFFSKNSKSRTREAQLKKWTKISAIVFAVVVVVLDVLAVILA